MGEWGGDMKVSWDHIVKGKESVHRYTGVISFRETILKLVGKVVGKRKERCMYIYLGGVQWQALYLSLIHI